MKSLVVVSALVFSLSVLVSPVGAEEKFDFVGVKKCKVCHKKPASGEQFGIWQKGPHAKAFETLAGEKAMAEAAKLGIKNPQEAPECLKCHVTAFPVMGDLANQKITMEEGVSCESCHGAGSAYYKKKTMVALTAGEIEPGPVGLTVIDEATCKRCHTPEGNSFYKEFDFATAVKKIAHPIPEGGSGASGDEDDGDE
ncbi:MAG: hypothetical protein DHS20C21_17230 [Gemmatimonadota bacterium]|nr:MAG: hypothetical protein DHS20C21_17230 [Gemmatimonadota bacterium]